MVSQMGTLGQTGLEFFGKMSASISHEIKNVLAIINENAGLLEDYILMTEKGIPLDPVRLKTLAEKCGAQIRRADGIIKNMNRLSHSIDKSEQAVDLSDILELAPALFGRFAAMKGVVVETKTIEVPLIITTSLFFLLNVIWLCLDLSLDVAGPEKKIGLSAEKTETGALIRFSGLNALGELPADTFSGAKEKVLFESLKAELVVDQGQKEIILNLPGDIT